MWYNSSVEIDHAYTGTSCRAYEGIAHLVGFYVGVKRGTHMTDSSFTQKQLRFCAEYLVDFNACAAAKRAGFTDMRRGAKLLAKPHIKKFIDEQIEKANAQCFISLVRRKEILSQIAESAEAKDADKIKAIDILNKVSGDYVEKVQVDGLKEEQTKLDTIILHLTKGGEKAC